VDGRAFAPPKGYLASLLKEATAPQAGQGPAMTNSDSLQVERALAGRGHRHHMSGMVDKRTKGRHDPSQRSTQRWENEGGAMKGVRTKRARDLAERKKQGKAADLAGDVIDRHADRSATFEEQQSRKRRLLKGPKEFRAMRRDQPKTKR
jgi:hypothetical protein